MSVEMAVCSQSKKTSGCARKTAFCGLSASSRLYAPSPWRVFLSGRKFWVKVVFPIPWAPSRKKYSPGFAQTRASNSRWKVALLASDRSRFWAPVSISGLTPMPDQNGRDL